METFSALLAICAGYSPATGDFPKQKPGTRSFDVFFDLRLNKWLSEQSWGWGFETLSRSLWRHCNEKRTNSGSITPTTAWLSWWANISLSNISFKDINVDRRTIAAKFSPSQYKGRLTKYEDSHVKDKTVANRHIFNTGIPILVKRHLYIETAPRLHRSRGVWAETRRLSYIILYRKPNDNRIFTRKQPLSVRYFRLNVYI